MSYVNVLVRIWRLDSQLLKHRQTSKEMDIIGNSFNIYKKVYYPKDFRIDIITDTFKVS